MTKPEPLNVVLVGSEGMIYMPAEQAGQLLRQLAEQQLTRSARGDSDPVTPEKFAQDLTDLADRLDVACIEHSTRNAIADQKKAEERWREWEASDKLVHVSTAIACPPDRTEDVARALSDYTRKLANRLGPGVTALSTGWEEPPRPPDEPQQRIHITPL